MDLLNLGSLWILDRAPALRYLYNNDLVTLPADIFEALGGLAEL